MDQSEVLFTNRLVIVNFTVDLVNFEMDFANFRTKFGTFLANVLRNRQQIIKFTGTKAIYREIDICHNYLHTYTLQDQTSGKTRNQI